MIDPYERLAQIEARLEDEYRALAALVAGGLSAAAAEQVLGRQSRARHTGQGCQAGGAPVVSAPAARQRSAPLATSTTHT
jgi:hypothetical protein